MSNLQGEYNGTKEIFTVIDLETTDLDADKGQIIELAAIRTDFEQEYGRLEMKVGPRDDHEGISEFITNLTGISDDDIKGGITEQAAVVALGLFTMGSTVVAQYAPFDLSYLEKIGFTPEFFLDTRSITRLIDHDVDSASLGPTYKRLFGEHFDNAHTATADVEATVAVLEKQLERAESAGLERRDIQNVVIDADDRPLRYTPKHAVVVEMELPKREES